MLFLVVRASNEPCASENSDSCRGPAHRQMEIFTDAYGECRDSERRSREPVGMADCAPASHTAHPKIATAAVSLSAWWVAPLQAIHHGHKNRITGRDSTMLPGRFCNYILLYSVLIIPYFFLLSFFLLSWKKVHCELLHIQKVYI